MIFISKDNRINVIVYLPATTEGRVELEKRISQVHANAVVKGIEGLDCTTEQKLQLFDSILQSAKQERKKEGFFGFILDHPHKLREEAAYLKL